MFSLDGEYPSPRGYAIIANLFTDAINVKFGSNFKKQGCKVLRPHFVSCIIIKN
jgi:hypothetical protein